MDYSRELLLSLSAQAPVHALVYEAKGVFPRTHDAVTWEVLPYRRPSPLRSVFTNLPDVAYRFRSQAYLERAIELASNPGAMVDGLLDGIVVDFISMAWLVPPLRKALHARGLATPVVMVTHNHEGALRQETARGLAFPKNILMNFDARKAAALEARANAAADGITTIISEDASAFARMCATPSNVLHPGYGGPMMKRDRHAAQIPRTATIIGNRMAVHKIAVLEHALGALSDKGTDTEVQIDIAGGGNFTRLSRQYPNCRFHGFVDDISAHLAGARLGLVPDDLGGGFKMRVLTLAMHRVPILGLNSAMRGTTFTPGKHYIGVDSLAEMAEILPRIIDDCEQLDAIQQAAFDHCRANFSWPDRGERLASFFDELAGRPRMERKPACAASMPS